MDALINFENGALKTFRRRVGSLENGAAISDAIDAELADLVAKLALVVGDNQIGDPGHGTPAPGQGVD
jgi:hypothetical protein